MRAVTYDRLGPPEVLRITEEPEPHAGPAEIRIVVRACGVNPIDAKLRSGAMGEVELPRSIGSEVSGVVDEVGDEVTTVTAGDAVFGPTTGGAADFAVLGDFARVPAELDFVVAAAIPVAAETAVRGLDLLGVASGQTLLVDGAGGAVGTAAVQLAVARGARVIATASDANHARLRGYGAEPTTYGDGLAERVAELAPGGVDAVFDMGPPRGALPGLVAIAGDVPGRVLTISDFGSDGDGVQRTGGPGTARRWDVLDHVATLVARGELDVPVQATFPLERAAEAAAISEAGHVTGKLVLLVQ